MRPGTRGLSLFKRLCNLRENYETPLANSTNSLSSPMNRQAQVEQMNTSPLASLSPSNNHALSNAAPQQIAICEFKNSLPYFKIL